MQRKVLVGFVSWPCSLYLICFFPAKLKLISQTAQLLSEELIS